MPDYQKGKIYKIWSHDGNKVYIGSTTKEYLSQRMTAHRNNYDKWKDGKTNFTTSYILFDEYGIENCMIELIEACPCNSRDELNKVEGRYIREKACVNKVIAGQTREEYRENNERKIKESNKLYYQENKDTLLSKGKEYRVNNKETVKATKKKYRESNKDYIHEVGKRYRAENADKIKESKKLYYEANKERLKLKRQQKLNEQ